MSPGARDGGVGRGMTLVYHPGFKQDLQGLVDSGAQRPGTRAHRLFNNVIGRITELRDGAPGTHRLEYLDGHPDLSDCQTTYVGGDIDAKPSHRIVWRDVPPSRPGGPPVRQLIALGERNFSAAYHVAGSRLGRPVGFTLDELRAQPEPISARARASEARTSPSAAHRERMIAERKRAHPELFEPAGSPGDSSQGALER